MKHRFNVPKRALALLVATSMAVGPAFAPGVALAEGASGDVPEWAVDDGHDEHPEESPDAIGAQADFPATYDMRSDGIVTPVKSQGHMMSCWTFGGVAAAETSILSANTTAFGGSYEDSHIDLSERHLAYFSLNPVSEADDPAQAGEGMHTFATNPNAAFDAGGDSMFVTSLFSTGVGPVIEQAFPYRGVDENGESHTNLQIFDADPHAGTMKWVREQLQADGITQDPEAYYGKTEAEIVEHFKEKAREEVLKNVYYSPEEDWSIPLTSEEGMSNRCLQSGVLLKDGNILPDYWAEDDPDHTTPRADAMSSMKQEMLDGHGVSVAFCASKDDADSVTDDGGMKYKQYVSTLKGRDHGVCVVGWDDNFPANSFATTAPGNGAWIVKNSWGSTADACEDDLGNVVNNVEYGYKNDEGKYTGYFYLSYYDKTIDKLETMDFTDTLGSEERGLAVAQHDYMPACNGFYATQPSNAVVSSANVFDAEENFEIRGLSTFTAEPNTRVTFAVYELNDGAANPTDGKLLYRTSQNFGYEGYHRLDLTQRPVVAKGKKFSVVSTVSTITTDGKRAYQVAANCGLSEESARERKYPFYATAVVNPGESYISVGSGWQDWTQYKADNNVESDGPVDNFSIKAYGAVVDDPAAGELSVSYNAHSQTYGWNAPSGQNGTTAGTTGESKRLEAFTVTVDGADVAYRSQLQGTGWESDWVRNGVPSGATGESRRMEAMQIRLEGDAAETHDVWYRVHAQTFGWLGWASNGEPAGTSGMSKRLEAFEVRVLPKGQAPEDYDAAVAAYRSRATGQAHAQGIGWQDAASADVFGTTGQGKRLEALRLELQNQPWEGGIAYEAHVQGIGWQGEVADGALAGTTGESKRVEAVRIHLTGEAAEHLSVWYRVHSQTHGWLGWTRDGGDAGTVGLSKRAEAVEVAVLPKDAAAPGSTENALVTNS